MCTKEMVVFVQNKNGRNNVTLHGMELQMYRMLVDL